MLKKPAFKLQLTYAYGGKNSFIIYIWKHLFKSFLKSYSVVDNTITEE